MITYGNTTHSWEYPITVYFISYSGEELSKEEGIEKWNGLHDREQVIYILYY